MIILSPSSGTKTIQVIPRNFEIQGEYDITIKRDGDKAEEVIRDANFADMLNYVEVSFSLFSEILSPDSTCYLEITNDGKLWYRDKIYVTPRSVVDIQVSKHVIGGGDIYKTYSSVDNNTYIIDNSSVSFGSDTGNSSNSSGDNTNNGGSTDNGSGNTTGKPVITSNDSYYITLDEEFSFYIPATNNPTSYSVFGLIDGLTLDETTGEISGIVTGEETLESMEFTATNEFGSSSKLVFFYTTNINADTLLPPTNVGIGRVNYIDNYTITWGYPNYNGTIESTKIYKNDDFLYDISNGSNGSARTGINQSYIEDRVNTYKYKFIDSNGSVSRFSNKLIIDGKEATIGHRVFNHFDTGGDNTLPFIAPIQMYYIQKDVETTFDFSNVILNNPTSYRLASFFSTFVKSFEDTTVIGSITGSFNESTGVVTCLATGDEALSQFNESGKGCLIKATNVNGENENWENVFFKFVDTNPNQISKPKNLQLDTVEEDYLTWEYEPYNRRIAITEIYRNGSIVKFVTNPQFKGRIIGTGVDNVAGSFEQRILEDGGVYESNCSTSFQDAYGENIWKVRFKDEDGLYSDFSDEITINI